MIHTSQLRFENVSNVDVDNVDPFYIPLDLSWMWQCQCRDTTRWCPLGIFDNLKMTVVQLSHNNWLRFKSFSAADLTWSCSCSSHHITATRAPLWHVSRGTMGCDVVDQTCNPSSFLPPRPSQALLPWWIKTILCAGTLWVVKLTEQYLVMTLPPSSLRVSSHMINILKTHSPFSVINHPNYRGSAVEMFLDFQIGDCYHEAFFV